MNFYLASQLTKHSSHSKIYYAIISNSVHWHLVKLDSTFLVSEQHQVVTALMGKKLDKKSDKEVRKEWKEKCGLLVHIIYSIIQMGMSAI